TGRTPRCGSGTRPAASPSGSCGIGPRPWRTASGCPRAISADRASRFLAFGAAFCDPARFVARGGTLSRNQPILVVLIAVTLLVGVLVFMDLGGDDTPGGPANQAGLTTTTTAVDARPTRTGWVSTRSGSVYEGIPRAAKVPFAVLAQE